MELVVVCEDPDTASDFLARSASVVLLGSDAALLGAALGRLRAVGGGRVAVMVGDPADPAAEAAALAMAAELFGGQPVRVPTVLPTVG